MPAYYSPLPSKQRAQYPRPIHAYQRLRSKEQKAEERQRERLHFAASFSADFHQFDLPYWLSPLGDDPDEPEVLPLFNWHQSAELFANAFAKLAESCWPTPSQQDLWHSATRR
jgi:uncharacterized LabA/DUF88 family protein